MKIFQILFLLLISFCANAETNAILASVNGEPITVLDVVIETGRQELKASRYFTGNDLGAEIKKIRTNALESIITRKLIFGEYNKQPFDIPKQYIENAMDDLSRNFGGGDRNELKKAALKYGTTMEELRKKAFEKVAVEILVNEYCRRPCFTTPKQIYEYYMNNKNKFISPLKFTLYLLYIKNDGRYKGKSKEIVNLCTEKMDNITLANFRALAMVYSEDKSAENGGAIGIITQNEMKEEFYNALRILDTGKTVKIELSNDGVYFFYLKNITGGELREFKLVREDVKNELMHKQRIDRYNSYIERLKKQAIIRRY